MPFKKGETPKGAKPFPKGVSGNPKGRPKLPDIKEALARVLSDENNGRTALELTLIALRAKAVRGDVRAAEMLLSHAFGKPKQAIDHTTDGEKISPIPSTIKVQLVHTTPDGSTDTP